jgi:hypothetical protein
MRSKSASLAIIALASVVCAQTEPVPTRIHTEVYGLAGPSPVVISCDVWDIWGEATKIRLSGGGEGDLACLLVDLAPASYPTAWGELLVPPTALVIPGLFDSTGDFTLPIDLSRPEWVGYTVYFQGLCLNSAQRLDLSSGLSVTYHDGTPQPSAAFGGPTYEGPPLTATLVRQENPSEETMYQLVNEFDVPTGGWDALVVGTQIVDDEMQVHLNLVAPHPSWDVAAIPTTVRLPMDLGVDVGQTIRIFVWESVALTPSLPVYDLAALIDTSY